MYCSSRGLKFSSYSGYQETQQEVENTLEGKAWQWQSVTFATILVQIVASQPGSSKGRWTPLLQEINVEEFADTPNSTQLIRNPKDVT
jgi:hypothetical protein